LKYENIGKYSDLDIDENLFKEFNSGFKHIEKIEESNKDYKEDTLIDYLRDILDKKKWYLFKIQRWKTHKWTIWISLQRNSWKKMKT